MNQPKTKIPQELQSKVYKKFVELPLASALVVYARLVHGNMFKAQNGDLFGLNRRLVSKIYRAFILSLREDITDGSKSSKSNIPNNKKSSQEIEG